MFPELFKKSPLFYKRKLRSKRVTDQNWQLKNIEDDTFIECIDKPELKNGTTPQLKQLFQFTTHLSWIMASTTMVWRQS